MEEQLQVLFKEVKDHYSQDTLRDSPVDDKYELEMIDCAFESQNINEPVIMVGYKLKYFNHLIGFTSEINEIDVDARYNYIQGIFMALYYDKIDENEYELLDVELDLLKGDGKIVRIDSDITKDQIKQEMDEEMSLEQYVEIMSADLIDQFEYEIKSINKQSFNHLVVVPV